MNVWLAVGLGGALGSMARHAVNVFVSRKVTHAVPAATAVANLAGCLLIGVVAGVVVSGHVRLGQSMRAFIFVGVLGGFTTFSSFGLDTMTLLQEGRPTAAAANVVAQVGGGLLAVILGYSVARSM